MGFTLENTDVILRTAGDFYKYVEENGYLLTSDQAEHWTNSTLQQLGVNVSRRTRRAIAKELPDELKAQLNHIFAPLMWRNTNLSADEFGKLVARRSRASSDPVFAMKPIGAVFTALKKVIGDDLSQKVLDDLSPELSQVWDKA